MFNLVCLLLPNIIFFIVFSTLGDRMIILSIMYKGESKGQRDEKTYPKVIPLEKSTDLEMISAYFTLSTEPPMPDFTVLFLAMVGKSYPRITLPVWF